jgi:hypothetical protein
MDVLTPENLIAIGFAPDNEIDSRYVRSDGFIDFAPSMTAVMEAITSGKKENEATPRTDASYRERIIKEIEEYLSGKD